ncbi:MAG: Mov34/MPN/PAD-1 family protein [Bacteroidia bacterium]|nr:Mov34/MPN/PAD-1 family protein [Bacteroidia bacterium]
MPHISEIDTYLHNIHINFSNLNIHFQIPKLFQSILSSYKQDRIDKLEQGGLLFGAHEENTYSVKRISEPNSFDKSTRFTIDRNKEIDNLLIKHEERNSAGTILYLGEWHTHPQDIPRISRQDQTMMKLMLKLSPLNPPRVFLAIQGTHELGVWTYDGKEITKLEWYRSTSRLSP